MQTITITPELLNTLATKMWLYKISVREDIRSFNFILTIRTEEKFIELEISEEQATLIKSLMDEVKKSKKEIVSFPL